MSCDVWVCVDFSSFPRLGARTCTCSDTSNWCWAGQM